MEATFPLRGGCLCGSIRYEVTRFPRTPVGVICHCTDCRRVTGSAFIAAVVVRKDDFVFVQGKPSIFEGTADSGGRVNRYFCGACGSPLCGMPEFSPRAVNVLVGTMDDSSWFAPTLSTFTDRAAPWFELDKAVSCFAEMPPVGNQ